MDIAKPKKVMITNIVRNKVSSAQVDGHLSRKAMRLMALLALLAVEVKVLIVVFDL